MKEKRCLAQQKVSAEPFQMTGFPQHKTLGHRVPIKLIDEWQMHSFPQWTLTGFGTIDHLNERTALESNGGFN